MKRVPATREGIEAAAEAIRAGEIVAYPTETVYGLAVDPFSRDAIARLFAAKGRVETNPVLLVASTIEQVAQVTLEMSSQARALADAFWPGPLSMVLPKQAKVPAELCGGGEKVCVRITSNAIARALCDAIGHPITSTSANPSGELAPRSADDIRVDGVSICIDGGLLPVNAVSTVYDPDAGIVYRDGAIGADEIARALDAQTR